MAAYHVANGRHLSARTMALQLAHILTFGTSTPAVARTVLQGKDIIQVLKRTDEQDQKANTVLFDLMKTLLRCVEIHEQIVNVIADARARIVHPNSTLQPPSIPNLESKAESFVQAAKLAIAHATRLTVPFYGQDFGHKLNKMAKWAAGKYEDSHLLVQFARNWEPWVEEVLAMRNAVDHPSDKSRGRFYVRNIHFDEHNDGVVLSDPQWWLEGEAPQPMAQSMGHVIEGVIQLQEELLGVIFHEFKAVDGLVLQEIPIEQRNPQRPVRLHVGVSGFPRQPGA